MREVQNVLSLNKKELSELNIFQTKTHDHPL